MYDFADATIGVGFGQIIFHGQTVESMDFDIGYAEFPRFLQGIHTQHFVVCDEEESCFGRHLSHAGEDGGGFS